jgi:ssRNA-specific RNase YbeY (16S rRNA maturation enzyme)
LSEYLLNRYHTYGFDDAVFLSIESGVLISSIDLQQVDQIQSILSQYQPYLHSKNTYDVCVVLMQDGKIRALNTMRDRDDPE